MYVSVAGACVFPAVQSRRSSESRWATPSPLVALRVWPMAIRWSGRAQLPVAPPPVQICAMKSCSAELVASSRTDIAPARAVKSCVLELQPLVDGATDPEWVSVVATAGAMGLPPPEPPPHDTARSIRGRSARFMAVTVDWALNEALSGNCACAGVAELADAGDLKSPDPKGRVGSIPTPGTDLLKIVSCKLKIEVLLDNHRRFLAFVEKRVGDRALAEDILQDAFVRSVGKADDVPDEALVPWFYTTLRNAVVDRYRRGAAQSRALEAFGRELEREREPSGDLDREICACVTRVATTLKPEYADALARVEVGGASLKTYAAEAGLTPNNAGVRVHRARQALKRKMMESCGLCAEHGCVDCTCGRG